MANGAAAPSFLARLAERQADLALSPGRLGLTVGGMGVGALVASPLAGRLVGRRGSRAVALAAATVLGASLWLAGAVPDAPWLFAALAVIGAADAAMDIAMNANGAAHERRTGRSVLHRLHGTWSAGALAAAGVAALAAAAGVPLTLHLAVVGAVVVALSLASRHGLVQDGLGVALPPPSPATPVPAGAPIPAGAPVPTVPAGAPGAPGAPVPPGVPGAPIPPGAPGAAAEPVPPGAPAPAPVGSAGRRRAMPAALAVLAAAVVGGALVEGAPVDWGAVRLEELGADGGVPALAVAAFMAGMLAARLVGDRLTDRWGGRAVLRTGTAVAAAGLAGAALARHPAIFIAALALAGAGASGVFPLVFGASSRTPGVAAGVGAATVSLGARLGFLAEPPLLGALADATSLAWSFAAVAAVAAGLAVAAPRIVPADRAAGGGDATAG